MSAAQEETPAGDGEVRHYRDEAMVAPWAMCGVPMPPVPPPPGARECRECREELNARSR